MKKKLLHLVPFLIGNVLLVLIHVWLFNTSCPKMAWLSLLHHLVLLVFYPYKQIFSQDQVND
ncbi:hypothetical protein D770_20365 [Flammeovirgaceae bacterium 311]|nr:hypothetical protein D770_20365 [Flammeovirgaceae bacterium 311]